jgi:phosphoserine aminotransferase
MLILSPKAVNRLESYFPNRPLPKIFRLVKNGKLIEEIFTGDTINTPSMLCVADALDSLKWMQGIGGLDVTVERANSNFQVLQDWLDQQDWIENLVKSDLYRSNTSVCLKIVSKGFLELSGDKQRYFIKELVDLLESEEVAYDIGAHREAPPGLRIWCGATVEKKDLLDLLPWLKWAFDTVESSFK